MSGLWSQAGPVRLVPWSWHVASTQLLGLGVRGQVPSRRCAQGRRREARSRLREDPRAASCPVSRVCAHSRAALLAPVELEAASARRTDTCARSTRTAAVIATSSAASAETSRLRPTGSSTRPRSSTSPRSSRFCEKESIAFIPYGGGTRRRVRHRVQSCRSLPRHGVRRPHAHGDNPVLEVEHDLPRGPHPGRRHGTAHLRAAQPVRPLAPALSQSFELSTLGGWIATRAGGHYATLYTHIDDFVESVRMVTPSGVLETRRLPASGAGPSPERFVLGSRVRSAIITEAWVRVQSRPRWRASASVHFARFEDAVIASRILSQSGLFPSNCRLLDPGEAMLHEVATDGTSVLPSLPSSPPTIPSSRRMERRALDRDRPRGDGDEPKYTSRTSSTRSRRAPRSIPSRGRRPRAVRRRSTHDANDASTWKQAFLDAPYLQTALVTMGSSATPSRPRAHGIASLRSTRPSRRPSTPP